MKRFLLLCAVCPLALAATSAWAQSASVTASPSHVQFGAVPIGGHKTATVTLTNDTSSQVSVAGVHLTEFPAGSGFGAESFCPATPLQPGDSCTVQVSMTGDAKGHYKGTVVLTTFMACALTPEGCSESSRDVVITLKGTTRPARAG
jgi:hypothetical protein